VISSQNDYNIGQPFSRHASGVRGRVLSRNHNSLARARVRARIMTAYGFWVPNDPRGSWSDFVASWELFRYRKATKTDTRRSVAATRHDSALRQATKAALKYPPVLFNGLQARAVGRGFARSIEKGNLRVYACAILPDHVHLVIGRHRCLIEMLVNFLKGEATKQLIAESIHPQQECQSKGRVPTCWARNSWNVFLNTAADIVRAIQYVERNPMKENKPAQHWTFVTPFGV
jgi:REP element-mobilizing transposase RayT